MTIKHPTRADIPALRALWQEAFGDTDAFIQSFFDTAFCPKRCLCLYDNIRPIAVLYFFDCLYREQPVAYFYAIATAKSHRGQGLCRKLMAEAHSVLQKKGYLGVLLVPGEQSLFRFYEKMGYQRATYHKTVTAIASQPIPFVPITKDAYLTLRLLYLPKDSVWQAGENLDFFATMTDFYKTDRSVFAIYRQQAEDKSVLVSPEFLGDSAEIPQIAAAMGFKTASMRTVGTSEPFAMYYALKSSPLPPPTYFGWAFD